MKLRYRLHVLMLVLGPAVAGMAWVQGAAWAALCHGVAAACLGLAGLLSDRSLRPVPAAEPLPEAPASRRAA